MRDTRYGATEQGIARRELIAGAAAAALATCGLSTLSGCRVGPVPVAGPAVSAGPGTGAASAAKPGPMDRPLAVMPAWRAAMRAHTWTRIGNEMGSVDPARNPALNRNFPNEAPWRGVGGFGMIMAAWSGGAYDRTTDTLRIFGGGHQDYAGNEIVQTMLATDVPQWSLAMPPSIEIGTDAGEPSNVYPDARPRSSHTYNQIVAVGADMYVMQGSQWRSGNAGNRLFRFRAGQWTDLGVNPYANWIQLGGMCHDEMRHQLLWLGYTNAAPMVSYDIATGAWKAWTENNQWSITGGTPRLVRVPPLDVTVTLYGDGFGVGSGSSITGARRCGVLLGRPSLARRRRRWAALGASARASGSKSWARSCSGMAAPGSTR